MRRGKVSAVSPGSAGYLVWKATVYKMAWVGGVGVRGGQSSILTYALTRRALFNDPTSTAL